MMSRISSAAARPRSRCSRSRAYAADQYILQVQGTFVADSEDDICTQDWGALARGAPRRPQIRVDAAAVLRERLAAPRTCGVKMVPS